MPDGTDLRAAVESLADARVRGDLATFASYLTPVALIDLHRLSDPPTPRSFEVIEVSEDGDAGNSRVLFRGSGAYEVHMVWERTDGHWRATTAAIAADSVRAPWWRRIPGFGAAKRETPERSDLE